MTICHSRPVILAMLATRVIGPVWAQDLAPGACVIPLLHLESRIINCKRARLRLAFLGVRTS